jgi:hypothetical protein
LGNVSKFIKGQTMAQKAKAELSGLTQANNKRCKQASLVIWKLQVLLKRRGRNGPDMQTCAAI